MTPLWVILEIGGYIISLLQQHWQFYSWLKGEVNHVVRGWSKSKGRWIPSLTPLDSHIVVAYRPPWPTLNRIV